MLGGTIGEFAPPPRKGRLASGASPLRVPPDPGNWPRLDWVGGWKPGVPSPCGPTCRADEPSGTINAERTDAMIPIAVRVVTVLLRASSRGSAAAVARRTVRSVADRGGSPPRKIGRPGCPD
jgi:hypothetical protein